MLKFSFSKLLFCVFFLWSSLASNAYAQLACAANNPNQTGSWTTLPYLMPINPISVTLLHTGKILIVAGSEWVKKNFSEGSQGYRVALWDPTVMNQSAFSVRSIYYDVWCSGVAVLPDGRPLIVGGTSAYTPDPYTAGDSKATIYDPATGYFAQTPDMAGGRWYATATTLGDGRVMAFSGLDEYKASVASSVVNNTVEIYDLKDTGEGWTLPVAAPFNPVLYPRQFLLPNGKVFHTGPGSSGSNGNAWIMDPANSTWTKSARTTMNRKTNSAVMLPLLPPDYKATIMSFGGGDPAVATTETIDPLVANPVWIPGPNMSVGRMMHNTVLLPNGKVLIEGGSTLKNDPGSAGLQANIYDPVSKTMSSGGIASFARLYHSSSLLLPDATVLSMGSNPKSGQYEPVVEKYFPSYLFDANNNLITTARPAITSTPGPIGYGQTFSITYNSNSSISSAVLIRPGSPTHGFDAEQRLIGLCGAAPQPPCNGNGTNLSLTTPPNGNIAPPGYYMLFIIDSAGVPSIAQFIQITPYTTTPPNGTIVSPATKVTIPLGETVSFSGTSTSSSDAYSWVFPGGTPGFSSEQVPGAVTFNTPGIFGATLTTVDASGNSDPSPPWRTVTVLPATTDFSITTTPAVVVAPGQNAQFVVTITPKNGFNEAVKLTASFDKPVGVTSGGMSPYTVPAGGTTAILTIKTTATTLPYAIAVSITGTSVTGLISRTAAGTLLIGQPSPTGVTTSGGGTGAINIAWQAALGATGYRVHRSLVSGGPYTQVACATGTSFTDTGLVSGTTYYYAVSADYNSGENGSGESANSSEVSATAP